MAVVISLASRQRAQPPEAPAALRAQPATILFFTGVRYERQDDQPAAEAPVRRRPRPLGTPTAARPKRPKKATSARQPA